MPIIYRIGENQAHTHLEDDFRVKIEGLPGYNIIHFKPQVVKVEIGSNQGPAGPPGIPGVSADYTHETAIGIRNGINTVFSVTYMPQGAVNDATQMQVYYNGNQLRPNIDYTRTGLTFTVIGFAPEPIDDELWVLYFRASGGQINFGTIDLENKEAFTILTGQPVALHTSGVGIMLAQAFTPFRACIGLAAEDIPTLTVGPVRTEGVQSQLDWTASIGTSTFPPGTPRWFLSTVTPGTFQTAEPGSGTLLQLVGISPTPTELDIRLEPKVIRR